MKAFVIVPKTDKVKIVSNVSVPICAQATDIAKMLNVIVSLIGQGLTAHRDNVSRTATDMDIVTAISNVNVTKDSKGNSVTHLTVNVIEEYANKIPKAINLIVSVLKAKQEKIAIKDYAKTIVMIKECA